jgi:hypothetical protein
MAQPLLFRACYCKRVGFRRGGFGFWPSRASYLARTNYHPEGFASPNLLPATNNPAFPATASPHRQSILNVGTAKLYDHSALASRRRCRHSRQGSPLSLSAVPPFGKAVLAVAMLRHQASHRREKPLKVCPSNILHLHLLRNSACIPFHLETELIKNRFLGIEHS